jgi:DNA recombination protein RmuC
METVLFVFSGALIGSLLTYFIVKSRFEAGHHLDILKKNDEQTALREQIARLTAQIDAEKDNLKTLQESLLDTFKAAASDAIGQSNQQFLTLAQTQFNTFKSEAETELENRKKAIEDLVKPVSEAINTYKTKVEELGTTSSITFGKVTEMMEKIQVTHNSLQRETGALVNALRNPRIRGRWGEIGLRRVVEFSGMSAHCDFNEQAYRESDEESILKPDMIINLPGNAHVVVDSKLPLDAYLEALETDDESKRNQLLVKHAKDLRDRINALSKKNYWSQFENSPDFVVLYMEIESAFNVALMTDKSLLQDAISNKIILATPTTLIVILKSVAMSWQQHNITENAREIQEAAVELHTRMVTFAEHMNRIGAGLKSALSGYNDAVGSYSGRLLPQGRKLEELSATANKKVIPEIDSVDRSVRALGETQD